MNNPERFLHLFRGRENAHGQYLVIPDGENDAKTHKGPATLDTVKRHMKGEGHGLGAVPILLDNTCHFGAIDEDNDGATDHRAIAVRVTELGFPLVVCASKSGGAHLYLFLKDPAPAVIVAAKLRQFAEALGLGNVTGRPIEIFPKQTKLPKNKVGNWINLPYYGGVKHGRVSFGPTGETLSVSKFLAYADQEAITSAELEAWDVSPTDTTAPVDATGPLDYADAPPCLQTVALAGFPEDSRNSALFALSTCEKMAHPDDWQDRAQATAVAEMGLTAGEAETTIGSVERGDYSYQANALSSCCLNSGAESYIGTECARRKYGVKAAKKVSADAQGIRAAHGLPIETLEKLLTIPPLYTLGVRVNDEIVKVGNLGAGDILTFFKVRTAVYEACGIILDKGAGKGWETKLAALPVTEVEAPWDATPDGRLSDLVAEWFLWSRNAENREDMERLGTPLQEGDVHIFRAADLAAFLNDRRFYLFPTPGRLWDAMRRLGAKKKQVRINPEKKEASRRLRVWELPTPKELRQEDYTPKVFAGPDF